MYYQLPRSKLIQRKEVCLKITLQGNQFLHSSIVQLNANQLLLGHSHIPHFTNLNDLSMQRYPHWLILPVAAPGILSAISQVHLLCFNLRHALSLHHRNRFLHISVLCHVTRSSNVRIIQWNLRWVTQHDPMYHSWSLCGEYVLASEPCSSMLEAWEIWVTIT